MDWSWGYTWQIVYICEWIFVSDNVQVLRIIITLLFYLIIYCSLIRFGCVEIVISDQGREFVNKVNEQLFELTGTHHRISSAYHPQTNGLVERFNQTIQRALLKLIKDDQQKDWDVYIDCVLFEYRTSVQKSTMKTPFEVMFLRLVYTCIQSLSVKLVEFTPIIYLCA